MMMYTGPQHDRRPILHQHISALVRGAGEPSLGAASRVATGEPVARPVPVPVTPAALAPRDDARVLRRLRHVVRRRVRVDLDGAVAAAASDGELTLRLATLSQREPRVLAWSADRLVSIVVLHDGCGARVVGGGGLMGRVELPSIASEGAFLSFCYDAEAAQRLS